MRYRRPAHKRGARVTPTASKPESLLQRKRSTDDSNRQSKPSVPTVVNEVLSSAGQPLDATTRSVMEARFGHDFSRVRVHADSRAAESARMVNARAYTVGQHIAFGAANFDPHGTSGRKLLAHELTHVVQQAKHGSSTTSLTIGDPAHSSEVEADHISKQSSSSPFRLPQVPLAGPVLQRSNGDPPKRIDVALVLDNESNSMAEAGARASTVLRIYSVKDAKEKLQALGSPIGTLYVISHGNSVGEVEIFDEEGFVNWIAISDFGSALKGALPPENAPLTVDFTGCKVGTAGEELESFREAIGAEEAKANNCSTFTAEGSPVIVDGTTITEESQLPEDRVAAFDNGLLDQVRSMTSEDGHRVGDCILGLARKQKATRKNLKRIKELYFANQGRLVASWASPEFNRNWQKGSICTKDMTTTTKPCSVVKKVKAK